MWLLELIKGLWSKEEPVKPQLHYFEIESSVIRQELEQLGIAIMHSLMDEFQTYRTTTEEGWEDVIDYIDLKYKLPKYKTAWRDCDDFAIWFKGIVGIEFGLSACAFSLGFMPQGFHAYITVRTESGWKLKEPQPFSANYLFAMGEHGYEVPQKVLI